MERKSSRQVLKTVPTGKSFPSAGPGCKSWRVREGGKPLAFVNAEMATRVTMAASRWQVRKGWSQQFLLVCEKQTNKQTTSSDPEKHSLKFSGGQRRYVWAYLGPGTNLPTGSKNTFHHFFAHFVQLTKALMNNYYSKYCIYMSETKA